jgi:fatty-acyl-CoA synthase
LEQALISTSAQSGTLAAIMDDHAARNADAIALWHEDEELTFGELQRRTLRLAHGLQNAGLDESSRIALWLPNRPDWIIWLFAAARIGALVVAVNTRFRAAEIEDILQRTGADTLVLEPGFKGIDFAGILADVSDPVKSGLRRIVTCGGEIPGLKSAVPDGEFYTDNLTLFDDGAPDDPIILFTTSGTTSKPKFVLHPQSSLSHHARDVVRAFAYDDVDTVLLQALPLCGTFGLAQALAGLASGHPSILMPAFDAGEAIKLIRSRNVTTFNGPDEMFSRLIEMARPDDFETVKWCGFAGFATSDPVAFVIKCAASGLHMTGLFGMSEVQALYTRQPLDAPVEERALAGGSLISPHAAAEARDSENGEKCAPGQSGELYFKGPSLFREYLNNPAATKSALGIDGFVRSGDLGYIKPDGGIVFEARMGDSLRLDGFLVNPAEIDAWILGFPGISASESVGVETQKGLRAASFIIATNGPIDETKLIDHCRQGLAKFKVPVAIFQVDTFPTSLGPNGEKIQRAKLRDMARDNLIAG